jgi:hypothetical protein
VEGTGQMLMILLAHIELDGLICSGRVVDGEDTYALFTDRVPALRRLDRHRGTGLARRRHGCR